MTTPDDHAALAGLNEAQRRAAEAVHGPVCILAGAGSGKTRTITHRIAHQVARGAARPEEILAVTFTDRAARELRQRLHDLGLERPVRAATFHAAAWAQLRHFWATFRPGEPLPDVLESKLRLLVPFAQRLRAEARDLAADIEWAKARRIAPDRYAAEAGGRDGALPAPRMAEVYAGYEAAKRERHLVDYDDMIALTTEMLTTDPGIAEAVRARYRSFTVDEFQDVNPAQWGLLQAWLGERRELCVVGDDDQAIYSFTGATPSYLTGFAQRYPDAVVVTLTENYRSTGPVLSLANRVLRAGDGSGKQLRAQTTDGPEPRIVAADDDEQERALVVARVRELIADGVAPSEIAICYRTNSQSEAFEAALHDAGIPYTVRGDVAFYQRPEIRQALSALREATAPTPATAVPPPGDAGPPRPPPLRRAVERVLSERLSWHPRRPPSGRTARERWAQLAVLAEMAGRADDRDDPPALPAFVAELEERSRDGAAADPDAVSLLTLHKSKGLEFDAVFLVAVEEGLLPISFAKTDEEIAEERRLLYVGVTRARRHLQLSWSATRAGRNGRPLRRRPSRFLEQPAPPTPAAANPELADRLRQWRRRRAREDGVPAYVIFPDTTLTELAARRPSDDAALRAVPGLGPTRVARYGPDLLQVLSDP